MVLQTFQSVQVNFEGHQRHMACSAQLLILLRKTGRSANTGRGWGVHKGQPVHRLSFEWGLADGERWQLGTLGNGSRSP